MVNSGTEAVMSALRLARAATGRDDIIKFEGCYHGHSDQMLVKAGSGALTLGAPDSPGVPADLAKHTLNLPYNNLDAVEKMLRRRKGKVAAVILEPVAANARVIPPAPGFLEGLRELTTEYGALLIFDEVITGFRVAYGGAQERFGVRPDLTCLGKIIGGGLPVGAYGRTARPDGADVAGRPVLPGGHSFGQSLGHGGGDSDPGDPQPARDLRKAGAQRRLHGRRCGGQPQDCRHPGRPEQGGAPFHVSSSPGAR